MTDHHDLQRFVDAQQGVYPTALAELTRGRKATHWMWFVFPQIAGLGHSAMAQRYAIDSGEEARAYLGHPVLGPRLLEATAAVTAAPGSAEAIMGGIDAVKLRSSLTLFAAVADDPAPFEAALDRLFGGERDPETMRRL
jgi:uncharacterized protein (DUF1810 family)